VSATQPPVGTPIRLLPARQMPQLRSRLVQIVGNFAVCAGRFSRQYRPDLSRDIEISKLGAECAGFWSKLSRRALIDWSSSSDVGADGCSRLGTMAAASADSLRLPIVGGSSGAAGGGAGEPPSPRHALSPLLEVRRPHCTLNCASCTAVLEERFRHSK
jgi:hypothetical protein